MDPRMARGGQTSTLISASIPPLLMVKSCELSVRLILRQQQYLRLTLRKRFHLVYFHPAEQGHLGAVRALLDGGAEVFVSDHDKWVPRQASEV